MSPSLEGTVIQRLGVCFGLSVQCLGDGHLTRPVSVIVSVSWGSEMPGIQGHPLCGVCTPSRSGGTGAAVKQFWVWVSPPPRSGEAGPTVNGHKSGASLSTRSGGKNNFF